MEILKNYLKLCDDDKFAGFIKALVDTGQLDVANKLHKAVDGGDESAHVNKSGDQSEEESNR